LLAEQALQQAQKLSEKLATEYAKLQLNQAQQQERIEQLSLALELTAEQLIEHDSAQQQLQQQGGSQQQQLQQLRAQFEQKRQQQQQLLMQQKVAEQQLSTL